ncbi:group I intron-associated PD-(D/E)XK endonuclease [Lewinella sp. LCG006]|uniref:group I intron-associated PD-(D/E)XK endonuclease n=1 Tax=Lewinella sp. LCG006 TaxID=3231911 RepID=UPI00345F5B8C
MKKHHTKSLGDLGILKAQLDLFEKGFIVAIPQTEHAPFDLMIHKGGVSRTVQVKARSVDSRGNLNINFSSTYSDSKRMHNVAVDKKYIDIYCVYCPDTDKCYYFDPNQFNKSVCLRVEIPKNNQRQNVNFADDYCQVP